VLPQAGVFVPVMLLVLPQVNDATYGKVGAAGITVAPAHVTAFATCTLNKASINNIENKIFDRVKIFFVMFKICSV
jgi:hypothetical protein